LISRGPQGIYGVKFLVSENMVMSEEDFIYLESKITSLYVDPDTYPPSSQAIGQVFTIQPRVRVLDQNGDPVPDKYVIAFSWPEPIFQGAPTTNLIQGKILCIA
jgi:hypothetical protein